MAGNSDFGGFFDEFVKGPTGQSQKKPEKGVPWHAKVIDEQYYVPLTDVLELLKVNNILPAVQKGLERRINGEQ